MKHKFINEIEAGETINDIYMVREPILRSTTRGDLYIAMYHSDSSGHCQRLLPIRRPASLPVAFVAVEHEKVKDPGSEDLA